MPNYAETVAAIRFNPHPPVGAGATSSAESGATSSPHRFNPHPPVGAGATVHNWLVQWVATRLFQSSPARGGGCNSSAACTGGLVLLFQSSPARGGGCNRRVWRVRHNTQAVSILTRPWGRVQLAACVGQAEYGVVVSILTRPWGRVQLVSRAVLQPLDNGFNPHPPVGAGATLQSLLGLLGHTQVSILTRPWGRVQRYSPNSTRIPRGRFQSSPARGGGCNSATGS